jgi:hypothetical protein
MLQNPQVEPLPVRATMTVLNGDLWRRRGDDEAVVQNGSGCGQGRLTDRSTRR